MSKGRKHDWCDIRDLASNNGLTLRHVDKKGPKPHKFELVIARTPVGTDYMIGGMSVEDIENDLPLSNGKTITQNIIANAVRSKK
ncbi:hypothetical protein H4W00_001434 [Psychrobacter sp. PL19]|uniref:hypothetical protein n=1 Tax=Psychrobacter sp. PL19 TaxID=2760711 RepID=UPI001AE98269